MFMFKISIELLPSCFRISFILVKRSTTTSLGILKTVIYKELFNSSVNKKTFVTSGIQLWSNFDPQLKGISSLTLSSKKFNFIWPLVFLSRCNLFSYSLMVMGVYSWICRERVNFWDPLYFWRPTPIAIVVWFEILEIFLFCFVLFWFFSFFFCFFFLFGSFETDF